MREKFKFLDDDLLVMCQKLAHKIERTTGITCYSIARLGLYMMAVQAMMGVINYSYRYLWHKTSFITAIVLFSSTFICFMCDVILTKAENASWRGAIVYFTPKYTDYKLRLAVVYMLWVSIFFTIEACYTNRSLSPLNIFYMIFFPLGCTTYFYFGHVNPLPPGKSRLRKWLESRGHKLKLAIETNN